MSQYRPLARSRARRRRGHPHAFGHAEGAAPAVRPADGAARRRRARASCRSSAIVVVVGHGAERVTKTLQEQLVTEVPVEFVEQHVQRGTGDAVSVALTAFVRRPRRRGRHPRLPGDAPLLRAETIAALATEHRVPGRGRHGAHRPRRRPDRLRPGRARQGRPGRPRSSSTPTPPTRSSRSTRSTRRSTASAAACSRRRCAGSAPRTRRASTT